MRHKMPSLHVAFVNSMHAKRFFGEHFYHHHRHFFQKLKHLCSFFGLERTFQCLHVLDITFLLLN